jgi:ankyrin repeat protein
MRHRIIFGIGPGFLLSAMFLVACRDINSVQARLDFRTAVVDDQAAAVKRWLDQGFDPNEQPTGECSTPLAIAVLHGNYEIIGLILDHGVNINAAASSNGQTVLHCVAALEQDAPEMTSYLLQRGAEVNVAGEDGMTPLMLASARGDVETVRALLTVSPDLELRTADGKTAIDLAAAANHREVVSLLRLAGARTTLRPPGQEEEETGATGLNAIATENGLIMLGETYEDAQPKLDTGVRLDLKMVSPTRNVEIRRFNNQTYRLTYERDGKTGPFRLIRIEVQ